MSYLRLASALKTLAQKASHPSNHIYKLQLAGAKQQQLNRGEIGDGKTGVVELAAPQELKGEQEVGNEESRSGVEGLDSGETGGNGSGEDAVDSQKT